MAWEHRLPDGMTYSGRADNYHLSFGVTMPTDAEGLLPAVCPEHDEHRFKVRVESSPTGDAEVQHTMTCPYCGHVADTYDFLPQQLERAQEAIQAAAQQWIVDEFGKMMRQATAGWRSLTFRPGSPPPVAVLPTYDIDETRRAMRCSGCDEVTAVYGLAFYCPYCGVMAPATQFRELLRVQHERLAALDDVDAATRQRLDEAGVYTVTYESTIKDAFGALETYLKQWFHDGTPGESQPPSTTFQRLNDTNRLFKDRLGIDLAAAAGLDGWAALLEAAAIRHVLTHNAGIIDDKFLARMPGWSQTLGQRVHVSRSRAEGFLDALGAFAAQTLET